jgi:hypothetical protein
VAFKDELLNVLGWGSQGTNFYKPYSATDPGSDLPTAAQNAVNDHPNVIVAAGTLAASLVLAKAPSTTPIILVGGEAPSTATNLTGFLVKAYDIAKDHATSLVSTARNVTIVYDPQNPPSAHAFANAVVPTIPAPRRNPLTATTYDDIKNLDATKFTDGFMLIPNATYYRYYGDIVKKVDGNAKVKLVFYPEREFKRAHANTTGVKVHGHNIPLTFRWAASYVDSILKGDFGVGSLPDFKEAITDDC